MQFAPPVAANRDQCGSQGLDMLLPELDQDAIEDRCPRVDEIDHRFAGLKAGAQVRASGG